jgi:hypothetical protein
VGGLAAGLPADPAVRVVELPRRLPQGLVIAHVGALPLEEILPSVTGAGAGFVLARAWIKHHVRRRRGPGS